MKKILFLVFFTAISVFAADKNISQDLSNNALSLYNLLVSLFQKMRWVFAILPPVLAVVSFLSDYNRYTNEAAGNPMQVQQHKPTTFQDLFPMLMRSVLVIVGMYLIYGIFGIAYADASSMKEVWDVLVVSFWKGLL